MPVVNETETNELQEMIKVTTVNIAKYHLSKIPFHTQACIAEVYYDMIDARRHMNRVGIGHDRIVIVYINMCNDEQCNYQS